MKNIKLFSGVTAMTGVMALALVVQPLSAATTTEVVTGNTVDVAAGENGSQGWWFNRDVRNQTPYEFYNDESSIGDGSLYVKPIGANPADKFIAENFIQTPVDEVSTISYDFMIGEGGTNADANEFYMNLYANFAESPDNKYYDCRYDFVPTMGSTEEFTTATFDLAAPQTVTRSNSAPAGSVCPTAPADMGDGATIRMFSINVGQTNDSDEGLAGYLDNVVVTGVNNTVVYDFEAPDTTAPIAEITNPADGSAVHGTVSVTGEVTDDNPMNSYFSITGPNGYVRTSFNGNGQTTHVYDWDTTTAPDGVYTIRFETRDQAGNKTSVSTDTITVTVNNVVDNKEQCKDGGWTTFSANYKNQGQCIASVQNNQNSKHRR